MNCLKFNTINDYFASLNKAQEEQLVIHYKKNLYLSECFRRAYNTVRSHVVLDFVDPINDYYQYQGNSERYDLESVRKACQQCIIWCDTHLDISHILHTFENQSSSEAPTKYLLEAVKKLAKRCYRYNNAMIEFCIKARNYASYILKRFFNEIFHNPDKFTYSDDNEEYTFDSDEKLKQFEQEEYFERKDSLLETIEVVSEEIYYALDDSDDSFSFWIETHLLNDK